MTQLVYIVMEISPGADSVMAVYGSEADAQDYAKRRAAEVPDYSRLEYEVEQWEVREGI